LKPFPPLNQSSSIKTKKGVYDAMKMTIPRFDLDFDFDEWKNLEFESKVEWAKNDRFSNPKMQHSRWISTMKTMKTRMSIRKRGREGKMMKMEEGKEQRKVKRSKLEKTQKSKDFR
jgi:hypothetical protein